jgi:hypothetical protein
VESSGKLDYIFIGAGPTSLEAVQVVMSQKNKSDLRLAIISPDIAGMPKTIQSVKSQEFDPEDNSANAMIKNHLDEFKHYSQAFFWGASCLPSLDHERKAQDYKGFFGEIASRWQVQAEKDAMSRIYSLSGEVLGRLTRKEFANKVSQSMKSNEDVIIGHSRLAISTEGSDQCSFHGQCFNSCPSQSPWNPQKLLRRIVLSSPNIILKNAMVNKIESTDGEWRVTCTNGNVFQTKNVVLSAGWERTLELLSNVPELKKYALEKNLKGTPVTLIPIFLKKRTARKDFESSFVYHDLIQVLPEKQLFIQIYLPTHEIAKRTLMELPVLGQLQRSSTLRKIYELTFGRHLAIAMVFSKSSELTMHEKLDSRQMKNLKKALKLSLNPIGGILLNFRKKHLSPKESFHVGAFSLLREKGYELMYGRNHVDPLLPGLHVIGPMLLPDVEPGPHTISAAALSSTYFYRKFKNE